MARNGDIRAAAWHPVANKVNLRVLANKRQVGNLPDTPMRGHGPARCHEVDRRPLFHLPDAARM